MHWSPSNKAERSLGTNSNARHPPRVAVRGRFNSSTRISRAPRQLLTDCLEKSHQLLGILSECFSSNAAAWQVRAAAVWCVARPVVLVATRDRSKPEYGHVWRKLVEDASTHEPSHDRNAWRPKVDSGVLVMLLGLEAVGFEEPRVDDQVLALDTCEFVVRERYALMMDDVSVLDADGNKKGKDDGDD